MPPAPSSSLFPYTTLFRSVGHADDVVHAHLVDELHRRDVQAAGQRPAQADRPVELAVVVLGRSEEHTSELQSRLQLVCRLLLEKIKMTTPSWMPKGMSSTR